MDRVVAQIHDRDAHLGHGEAEVVVTAVHRNAAVGAELPAVALPLAANGDLGVEAAREGCVAGGLLPPVVAQEQGAGAAIVGVKPGVSQLAAQSPEAIEIAGAGAVAVEQGAAAFLQQRREKAQIPQDQTGGLPQAFAAGIAAPGAGAEAHHRAQPRIAGEDVHGSLTPRRFCRLRSTVGQHRFTGEHRQLIAALLAGAQHVGGAAHPQHLAAQATALGTVHQHRAAAEAKAVLPQGDQAVAAQETDGSAIEQQFGAAVAGAHLLAATGGLVHPGRLAVDEHLASIDDPSHRGVLKRCRQGRAQTSREQRQRQQSTPDHHAAACWIGSAPL